MTSKILERERTATREERFHLRQNAHKSNLLDHGMNNAIGSRREHERVLIEVRENLQRLTGEVTFHILLIHPRYHLSMQRERESKNVEHTFLTRVFTVRMYLSTADGRESINPLTTMVHK